MKERENPLRNAWNDSALKKGREFISRRPWYAYALSLLDSRNIGGSALDVGCGVGEFLTLLQTRGFRVAGCDGSLQQVENVRALGFQAELVDLEGPLPFPDKSFGLVSCLEVIEHIVHAEALLREMSRVLAPDGFLVLSTPNFSFWQYRLRYLFGGVPHAEGIHLRFFNSSVLRRKLGEAGFHVVKTASFCPATGLNFGRGLINLPPCDLRVPGPMEGFLASDLVALASPRKRRA